MAFKNLFLLFVMAILLISCSHTSRQSIRKIKADAMIRFEVNPTLYLIQANDLLRVQLLEDKSLARLVRVEQDGSISLPLIGIIHVTGYSTSDVERIIASAYQGKYIREPHVTVFIEEKNGNRITVTGAVMQPGLFEIKGKQETLQQALAEAKGVSKIANLKNVIVFRQINGMTMMARFDLNAIEKGRYPDPVLQGGDTVVVIRSNARSLLQTVIEMTPLVMVWRAYR